MIIDYIESHHKILYIVLAQVRQLDLSWWPDQSGPVQRPEEGGAPQLLHREQGVDRAQHLGGVSDNIEDKKDSPYANEIYKQFILLSAFTFDWIDLLIDLKV